MRNLFCLGVFLFFAMAVVAQEGSIGRNFSNIETDFKASITESGVNENGELYLISEDTEFRSIYVFDSEHICYICYVFPKNELIYGNMVNRCNADFTSVGSRSWHIIDGGKTIAIEERRSGDGTMYFEFK